MQGQVSLLSQHYWLNLPQETRDKLVKLFGIQKTGTIMTTIGPEGAKVISDGFNFQDFYPITVSRMNELLGWDDEDFYALFSAVIENIDELLNGSYGKDKFVEVLVSGNTKKEIESEIKFSDKPRFCNFCDSKGVRHKKECPHYVSTR